jgi:hypothetical protein
VVSDLRDSFNNVAFEPLAQRAEQRLGLRLADFAALFFDPIQCADPLQGLLVSSARHTLVPPAPTVPAPLRPAQSDNLALPPESYPVSGNLRNYALQGGGAGILSPTRSGGNFTAGLAPPSLPLLYS